MTITYLFRSPGTGHSLEELFGNVAQEISIRAGFSTDRFYLPYISRGWRSVWQNLRSLRGLPADLYHITGDVHYAALALPASRTVLTIHDCIPLYTNRKRPLRYAIFWLFWYYLPVWRAGVVTVVSEKTRKELISYLGRIAHKAIVIENGYNPDFTHNSLVFRAERPVLLQVGTAPHKNLVRLIAALDGIACVLEIVGPLSDKVRTELVNRRIDYRNHINVSQKTMIRLYQSCDIVTFLSTYEGFGMPVLEANAVGRVVLTSAISPLREMALDAAHFVDSTDVAAIRAGILNLIQDGAYRQTLIENGLINARRFTVARVANSYAEVYRKIGQR